MEYSIKHIKEHKLDEKVATLVRHFLGINIDFDKQTFSKPSSKGRTTSKKIDISNIDWYLNSDTGKGNNTRYQTVCVKFPSISSKSIYLDFYMSGWLKEITVQDTKKPGKRLFSYDVDRHVSVTSDKKAFSKLQIEMSQNINPIYNERAVRVFVNDVAGQYFNPSDIEFAKNALAGSTVVEEKKPELPQKTELEQQRDEAKQKITEDLLTAANCDPSRAREFLNAVAVCTAPWYKCFAPEKTNMLGYQHQHVNIPIN